MLACAESNFLNFKFEYLCENEFLRKIILACLSWAQMGSIHEKNRGRKSRDTVPLKRKEKKQRQKEKEKERSDTEGGREINKKERHNNSVRYTDRE